MKHKLSHTCRHGRKSLTSDDSEAYEAVDIQFSDMWCNYSLHGFTRIKDTLAGSHYFAVSG